MRGETSRRYEVQLLGKASGVVSSCHERPSLRSPTTVLELTVSTFLVEEASIILPMRVSRLVEWQCKSADRDA